MTLKPLLKAPVKLLLNSIGKERVKSLILSTEESALLGFKKDSYLQSTGWTNSYVQRQPLDEEGNPIPWTTYSYISYIQGKLTKEMSLFEFGSGNSTLFYSKLVDTVTSVEHDPKWFEQVKTSAPSNVSLNYQELRYGGDYCEFVLQSNRKYDIVIIDGRDRVNSCINSIDALSDSGVIVLDDSERKQYSKAVRTLASKDFRRIDFWGIAPGVFYNKCTSLFYRDGNCLTI